MGQQVYTAVGLVDRDRLDIGVSIEEGPNFFKVRLQYKLDGQIVRESPMIDVLRPLTGEQSGNGSDQHVKMVQGKING